ncbi:hypothetical protein [Thalassotalea sp. Y01]|uniref:hypothetical protein n=1 Tax=Thalassotalea sp. Y01 TaxID=2729613 RepID=UPI00145E4ED5|nr:hypothetical protein [Thalassotalea sp. Y01]NMP17509.1 hypothetical protein [Thalassotalea sp. Y01]
MDISNNTQAYRKLSSLATQALRGAISAYEVNKMLSRLSSAKEHYSEINEYQKQLSLAQQTNVELQSVIDTLADENHLLTNELEEKHQKVLELNATVGQLESSNSELNTELLDFIESKQKAKLIQELEQKLDDLKAN